MRTINKIILHCTATKRGQRVDAAEVTRWHKARGFRTIGYHFLVLPDGTVENGRPVSEIGAHCKGHNAHSIGVCYVGGLDSDGRPADTRTDAQKESLRCLISKLEKEFPKATLHGHREFAAKACPCFDVAEYRR